MSKPLILEYTVQKGDTYQDLLDVFGSLLIDAKIYDDSQLTPGSIISFKNLNDDQIKTVKKLQILTLIQTFLNCQIK